MPPSTTRMRKAAEIKAKKKAEEDAKAAEEARIKEEERLREEERLCELEAEKARSQAIIKSVLSTQDGKIRDLRKFLNSVPLTQKCIKKFERELSDGVAVAEIIAHYCPEICDPRHYFPWCSAENKRSNWDNLNRTVFPELGFQLTRATINNILRPYACGKFQPDCPTEPEIYKVLRKVRYGLAQINPAVYDYRLSPDYECEDEPCVPPEKPKFVRQPRVSEDKPPFSKLEIEIANGKFDEEDRQLEYARACCCGSSNCTCCTIPCCQQGDCSDNCDWVKFQSPGGGILYQEQACGDYESQPIGPPQQCWKI